MDNMPLQITYTLGLVRSYDVSMTSGHVFFLTSPIHSTEFVLVRKQRIKQFVSSLDEDEEVSLHECVLC
jgi:hypothetical protein